MIIRDSTAPQTLRYITSPSDIKQLNVVESANFLSSWWVSACTLLVVCRRVMQRLIDDGRHSASSSDDYDNEFLGYLYFSAVSPLGAHGNPPSPVMFVEMHMKRSGQSLYNDINHISVADVTSEEQLSLITFLSDVTFLVGSIFTYSLYYTCKHITFCWILFFLMSNLMRHLTCKAFCSIIILKISLLGHLA